VHCVHFVVDYVVQVRYAFVLLHARVQLDQVLAQTLLFVLERVFAVPFEHQRVLALVELADARHVTQLLANNQPISILNYHGNVFGSSAHENAGFLGLNFLLFTHFNVIEQFGVYLAGHHVYALDIEVDFIEKPQDVRYFGHRCEVPAVVLFEAGQLAVEILRVGDAFDAAVGADRALYVVAEVFLDAL